MPDNKPDSPKISPRSRVAQAGHFVDRETGAPATGGNRFPDGTVYAPAPEPRSAWLASAPLIASLTWMRSTLPRRSFEFSAVRRASPVGRW
jgi:hypothetical protein